jgi:glycine hydroxymethyltransferase
MAGAHPSPIDYAHITTTSTYKPGGPRGGLILSGKDYDIKIRVGEKETVLWEQIEKATFPGLQGTPYFNNIAGKAVFFKEATSQEYKTRQFKVIENASRLAGNLIQKGYNVLTGGTDNHLMLVNVAANAQHALRHSKGLTGFAAQKCLEDCAIVVDKMPLPYAEPGEVNGLRLGTPIVTKNGFGAAEIDEVSQLVDTALSNIKVSDTTTFTVEKQLADRIRNQVKELTGRFPIR